MRLELHKHPVWVTVGILSGMTFLFNAGFIYSTVNRDWLDLKSALKEVNQYKQELSRLKKENEDMRQYSALQSEQMQRLNDKINQCLALRGAP